MFYPGDRVYLLIDQPDSNECLHVGSVGTVLKDENENPPEERNDKVFVMWDDSLNVSDEFDGMENGHIWFVKQKNIRLCVGVDDSDEQQCSDEDVANFLFDLWNKKK